MRVSIHLCVFQYAKFWIIAFDTATEIINEHGIQGHGFANDSCAMIAGSNLHHMMSRMQKVINRLTDWGNQVGLKFNPSKTEVIIFSKSNLKANKLPNKLIMDDKRVPFSTHTKYLGVTLDSKLLWTQQWLNVIKAAKAYLFTLIPFISRRWGPRPVYTRWVYTTII